MADDRPPSPEAGSPTPRERYGPLLRAMVRVAASRAGAWWFIHVSSRIDPFILRRTNGRLSLAPGWPVLLLRQTGAKSGVVRETPLLYATDGPRLVVIASKGGAMRNPAWYHNLTAHPDCDVIAKGRSGRYRARESRGEERERLWDVVTHLYPGYITYQARAGERQIPLVVLEPA